MEKKYPIGGYAPGSYHCRCATCGGRFIGDKRAYQCEPCALDDKAKFDALSPAEQEELMKRNAEAINEAFKDWAKVDSPQQYPTPEEQRVMNKTTDKLFVRDKPGTANDPEFIEFIVNERNTISKEMLSDTWWLEIPAAKRVVFENVLIAYDQMVEKIKNIK